MAIRGTRWKYRDPSWYQIVWLYLGAAILAVPDQSPLWLAFGIGLTVIVTALVVVKVVKGRKGNPEMNTR